MNLPECFSNTNCQNVKLKNGFSAVPFSNDAELDFMFSIKDNDTALLLNVDAWGEFDMVQVADLAKTNKVGLISNETMEMSVFNLSKDTLYSALMKQ